MAANIVGYNFTAQNEAVTLGFSDLFSYKFAGDISLGAIMLAGYSAIILQVIILIYIWPLFISPDPENPLRWYYPCVCGCFRKSRKTEQEEVNAISKV